jgi:hypothetical protein
MAATDDWAVYDWGTIISRIDFDLVQKQLSMTVVLVVHQHFLLLSPAQKR